eukprot:TRINITY_DN722_c0_g1_i3.p1 TRINITY_DN722_c0_g1~~TRINITY_DN722_c0_g1_i3.p1  ORF type:complete len:208 (-),score=31.83 TRINITY_DN722_c0_g1_i3:12-635(-)
MLDVDIVEWIGLDKGARRICFYSISDATQNYKCVEDQTYAYHGGDVIEMVCNIVPDSSVGDIFDIKSTWTLTRVAEEEITLVISVVVECKEKIFGVSSAIESALLNIMKNHYTVWVDAASEECTQEVVIDIQKEHHPVRQSRRVSGTENLVRMLLTKSRKELSSQKISQEYSNSKENKPKKDGRLIKLIIVTLVMVLFIIFGYSSFM